MRVGVAGLAVLGVLGAAAELATARHWQVTVQLVPWVALGALVVAIALLPVARRHPSLVVVVRALAVLVLGASAFGVYEHIATNYAAGSSSRHYGQVWGQLSEPTRWWYAASMTVGSVPPLAAGVLGYAALLTLLATVGLRRRSGV